MPARLDAVGRDVGMGEEKSGGRRTLPVHLHTFNSTRVQQGLVVAAVCCPVVQEDGRA
jgi:1,4-dihydroxy-2-naphthoate octaprenyltransferase